jgi:hypothetical protein
MPVILYRDVDFGGPQVRLQPGFFSGRDDLEGTVRGSRTGETLDNNISSVRVDQGYVAVLFGGYSVSASGGARTLIGPTVVADLAAVGMDAKVSAIQVLMFEPYLAAVPRDFGVTLYSGAHKSGLRIHLGQGDHDRARLDSDEVKIGTNGIQSLCVGADTLAILYAGHSFESSLDSLVVKPNTCVEDLDRLGMLGDNGLSRVNSIRVLYAAQYPRTQRPAGAGVSGGPSSWDRAIKLMNARRQALHPPVWEQGPSRTFRPALHPAPHPASHPAFQPAPHPAFQPAPHPAFQPAPQPAFQPPPPPAPKSNRKPATGGATPPLVLIALLVIVMALAFQLGRGRSRRTSTPTMNIRRDVTPPFGLRSD